MPSQQSNKLASQIPEWFPSGRCYNGATFPVKAKPPPTIRAMCTHRFIKATVPAKPPPHAFVHKQHRAASPTAYCLPPVIMGGRLWPVHHIIYAKHFL